MQKGSEKCLKMANFVLTNVSLSIILSHALKKYFSAKPYPILVPGV